MDVPVVWFSLARLGLFAAALVVLYLVGMGGWLWVVTAAVIAWGLSYVLLGSMRDAALLYLANRPKTRKPSDDEVEEDALLDSDAVGADALPASDEAATDPRTASATQVVNQRNASATPPDHDVIEPEDSSESPPDARSETDAPDLIELDAPTPDGADERRKA